jgi:hypothetical protein
MTLLQATRHPVTAFQAAGTVVAIAAVAAVDAVIIAAAVST